mgnify:CR=1 FL=1|tara:strand:+ start:8 stop:1936 length:1929 start_codon:yes stop_codon:yes gene_type:complete
MAANKITIKFNSQGERNLLKALKNLAKAQDNLTRTTKKFGKAQDNTAKGGRLLNNAFATMRSKMLLLNFAMGLGIKQLGVFVKEAGKVQEMERAFTNLSGGAENASIAVDKLGSATNGTMSKFDLFQQANNAMILGVSKNSDEMAHMFDVAQRLGAALGKDTKHSVESLITGIGRQSRLMLDNIGIIVKADEAYQSYADKLGTSADKLSDSEKKQAFLNATMEAAEKKLLDVGEEVISYNAKLQISSARMADMRVELGDKLLPLFSTLSHHFTDTAILKGYALAIGVVTTGFIYYKRAVIQAAFATAGFKLAIKRLMAATGIGLVVTLLGELAGNFIFAEEATDGLTASIKKQSVAMSPIIKDYNVLIEQKKRLIQTTKDENAVLKMNIFDLAAYEDFLKKASILNEKETEDSKLKAELLKKRQEFFREAAEMQNMQPDFEIHTDAQLFAEGLETQEQALARFRKKQEVHDAAVLKSKLRSTSGMVNAFADMNTAMGGSAKASARLSQISASIDMYAGANKAFAQGGVMGFVTGAAIIAQGLANIVNIEKNIGKYEQGGMVGGRRHSQGGTMIEAEQGEFVMSRNAVNAVGVEAMNRINQGGGAGAVSINFTGNVMSQDFIEDEAIPMIKEAIRRGADIGVA